MEEEAADKGAENDRGAAVDDGKSAGSDGESDEIRRHKTHVGDEKEAGQDEGAGEVDKSDEGDDNAGGNDDAENNDGEEGAGSKR